MDIQQINQKMVDNEIELTINDYIKEISEHFYGIEGEDLMTLDDDTYDEISAIIQY